MTAIYSPANFSGLAGDNVASFLYAGSGRAGNGLVMNCDVYGPNLAKFTFMNALWVYNNSTGAYGNAAFNHESATQHTAFTVSTSTGTLTGGTIKVYGYKN